MMDNGAYFPKTKPSILVGVTDHFVGAEIVGWFVAWRQGTITRDFTPRIQRRRFYNPSRFGVMRDIVIRGREWSGKIHFLEIIEISPIFEAHYESRDNQENETMTTALPNKGQRIDITSDNGIVAVLGKCSSGRDWFLSLKPRCRFGNAKHIRADVEHFVMYGRLPERQSDGFA